MFYMYSICLDMFKVEHHRCQAIAFMFNGGSCSNFTFYPIDTKICSSLLCTTLRVFFLLVVYDFSTLEESPTVEYRARDPCPGVSYRLIR